MNEKQERLDSTAAVPRPLNDPLLTDQPDPLRTRNGPGVEREKKKRQEAPAAQAPAGPWRSAWGSGWGIGTKLGNQ